MRGRNFMAMALVLTGTGCGGPSTEESPWTAYQVSASLSTNSILIGQPVELQVTIDHPADVTPELPRLDTEASPLVVRDQSQVTEPCGEQENRTRVNYRITSFEVGDHLSSSNQVVFLQGGQPVHSNLYPFASLQVQSVLTNDQALVADKDLATWPLGIPRLVMGIAVVGLLAFLIAGLVVWFILKRGIRLAPAPPLPPAHVTALEAIDRLKRKNYIAEERREPFYVELSDIIRRYIEQRFGVHAPDQTTEEFMHTAMDSRFLDPAQQEVTRRFLEQCDLVKFARAHPGVEDMQAAMESAVHLIQATRISEAAVAA